MAKPKAQRSTGIMNKMRDKMPIIIIFLIVAFLGTIIFEWGMNYLGLSGGSNVMGMR
jgi:peptidyl-prolyl cis-trans isomerase D